MNKRKRVNRIPAAIQCHGRPGACPACTVDYIANDWDAKIWHDDATRDVVHTERKFAPAMTGHPLANMMRPGKAGWRIHDRCSYAVPTRDQKRFS